jgi:hypothetical protein
MREAPGILRSMRAPATLLVLSLLLGAFGCRNAPLAERDPLVLASLERGSDPRAVALAEAVLERLGGRAAWERARVLEWTFFGRRSHVWDRWTGDYRLDEGPKVVLMNLETGAGRVFVDGTEVTAPAARASELARAKSVWINDGYWLVMPYKLLDPGVTLRDAGQRKLANGEPADVLRLEFEGVGETPRNAYDVYVARDERLVAQWDYYEDRADASRRLSTPWAGWTEHGGILLCGDREPKRAITGIAVLDEPPARLRAP